MGHSHGAENIARHLSPQAPGSHPAGAAASDPVTAASGEITGAVVGSTLTTVLVFVPLVRSAIYRVAATIPGAAVVPHAANAVGRAGVAVSRSGQELIFDPKTYQLIGEGAVLTEAVPGEGPAGTVVASTAQLREAVTDHLPAVTPPRADKSGGGVRC